MKKNKKKLIIIALFVVTLGMGIGYSILSNQLKIEGTATVKTDFDVAITGIEKFDNLGTDWQVGFGASGDHNADRTVTEIEVPSFTSNTAKFNVRLGLDSSITYLVTIENKGNIAAIFDAADIIKSGSNDIKLTTPVDVENVVLSSGDSIKYIVTLSYPYSNDLSGETTSDISISFNARQVTNEQFGMISPYITFDNNNNYNKVINDKQFIIDVINLGLDNPYDNGYMDLYLSVDEGNYEKVNYKSFSEGDNYFEHFYQSNNITFHLGDTLYNNLGSGSHTFKFKLSNNDESVSSNEITTYYFKD